MAGIRAAKRYAKGLMQFANETSQADMLNLEMIDLKNSIQASRELSSFLASPVLDAKRKVAISKELFKGFSKVSQNFVELVINQGRGNILKEIANQYTEQYNKMHNITTAEFISAVPFDTDLVNSIVMEAKQKLGDTSTIKIETKVDPELIGGFVLRMGDRQIDSSVKSKLNRLKKDFERNEYIVKF